jgi:hypothetical protein
LSEDFWWTLLAVIGAAVLAYLVIAAIVYVGSGPRTRRYRPGRPFEFTSVWFLASPERQARAGIVPGRELTSATPGRTSLKETGGASDAW